tara:strand:- start:2 stop:490 length:489 start_codon:yes stop_codon:yes gene_type:complete
MEAHTRAALQSTRDLHAALKSLAKCVGDDGAKLAEITKLKRLAADANRSVQAIRRCTATKKIQTAVELNLLRAAVQGELVDREANSARILDRQRVIFDNLSAKTPSSVAFDRAAIAVQSIESELAKLCPNRIIKGIGVALLAPGAGATPRPTSDDLACGQVK